MRKALATSCLIHLLIACSLWPLSRELGKRQSQWGDGPIYLLGQAGQIPASGLPMNMRAVAEKKSVVSPAAVATESQADTETEEGDLGGLGGGGGTGSGDEQDPRYQVIRRRIERAKYYPSLAARRGMTGTVWVKFQVDNQGNPKEMQIVRSSGHSLLDEATLRTLDRAAPFPVVDGWVAFPLRFDLGGKSPDA